MTFALSAIAFFVFGVIVFYLDTRIGVPFQRSWYNMTHKNKLAAGIQKGFIVNASFVSRAVIALLIVAATFLLSLKYGKMHAFEYSMLAIVQLLTLILGFYFASKILKIVPPAVSKAADYLDKMEKGEVDLKKEIIEKSKKAKEAIESIKKEQPQIKQEKKIEKESPKEESQPKKGKDDWRKGIDDFLKK